MWSSHLPVACLTVKATWEKKLWLFFAASTPAALGLWTYVHYSDGLSKTDANLLTTVHPSNPFHALRCLTSALCFLNSADEIPCENLCKTVIIPNCLLLNAANAFSTQSYSATWVLPRLKSSRLNKGSSLLLKNAWTAKEKSLCLLSL